MLSGWKTPYEIASRRDQTKRGRDHLSSHGEEVISQFFNDDLARLATAIMMGRSIDPDRF